MNRFLLQRQTTKQQRIKIEKKICDCIAFSISQIEGLFVCLFVLNSSSSSILILFLFFILQRSPSFCRQTRNILLTRQKMIRETWSKIISCGARPV
jgi:hypothetical protein